MKITDKREKDTSVGSKVVRSKPLMQAVGDWIFRGNRVYMLSAPNRMLITKRINWDRETSDVEDEDGIVFYDVSWHDLEFWNPEDYHLPDDE